MVDALGRRVLVTSRNGPDPGTDWLHTLSRYDIAGNLLAIVDPLGGPRSSTTTTWPGDRGGGTGSRPTAAARERNLLGQLTEHFDGAGLVTVAEADFRGHVVISERRLVADAPILAVVEQTRGDGWRIAPFVVDWDLPPETLLEPTGYRTTTRFDALGRIVVQTLPADVDGRRRELVPRYHRGGGLEQVRLDDTLLVERIAYDARGRRSLVRYGNGLLTRYAYDPRPAPWCRTTATTTTWPATCSRCATARPAVGSRARRPGPTRWTGTSSTMRSTGC